MLENETKPFVAFAVITLSLLGLFGCARLPETTRVFHEDERVTVKMESDLDGTAETRTTPTDLSPDELRKLLRGFSLRPKSTVPIKALLVDIPPRKFLRERELEALVPVLREALQKVSSRERIAFEVTSPGRNPRYWREVTGGWIKVREPYFHLQVDYFHVEQPIRKTDAYDPYYPSPWTPEQDYSLYFEPEGLYVMDPLIDHWAVDLNRFREKTVQ
ncbi:MAG TPA: hypothetical protein PKA61_10170 [Nitrospira sp.]|nr:hypothetical protein [Nitrospira sp.]